MALVSLEKLETTITIPCFSVVLILKGLIFTSLKNDAQEKKMGNNTDEF